MTILKASAPNGGVFLPRSRAALGLAGAAALSLAGCAQGGPEAKAGEEGVTLVVKVPTLELTALGDPEVTDSCSFIVKVAEAFEQSPRGAGVKVDVQHFEIAREDEAIPQSFGTSNSPDVLYEAFFNMSTYIHSGLAAPLDDIVTPELRADIDEAYWNLGSVGGKVYMMPFLSLQNVLAFSKTLFREAGLERYAQEEAKIYRWTPEQWEEVLSTLAANLPKRAYPMFMLAKNERGDTHVMTLVRSQGSAFFDEDGLVRLSDAEGVAGLAWLKGCYDKGYFPPHCENLAILDCMELFTEGRLAIHLFNSAFSESFDTNSLGFVNFPSRDGAGYATSFVTGFEVFDNGDPAKLKAAKDFVSSVYGDPRWLDYSAGDLPVSAKTAARCADKIFMLDEFVANEPNIVDFTANNPNWRGVREVFHANIQDLLRGTRPPEAVAESLERDCNEAIQKGRAESSLHG